MAAQVIGTTETGHDIWGGTAGERTTLGIKPALTQFQEIGGDLYESNGSVWNPIRTNGAGHVAEYSLPADFRAIITPTISGVPTPEIEIDGTGTGTLVSHLIRVVVNPGDDVTAGSRLKNGYPEVFWCLPGESIPIPSESAITDIYLIGVDYVTTAPANYTGNAYIISRDDATDADWLSNMAHFNFESADSVKLVYITMSGLFNTNFARVKVDGVSYAQ